VQSWDPPGWSLADDLKSLMLFPDPPAPVVG
jgi:hypothetical protein